MVVDFARDSRNEKKRLEKTLLEFFDSRGARARFSSNSSIVQYMRTQVDARVYVFRGDVFRNFYFEAGFTKKKKVAGKKISARKPRGIEFILELRETWGGGEPR